MHNISLSVVVAFLAFVMLSLTANADPHWGSYKHECVTGCCNNPDCIRDHPTVAKYSAILWDLPGEWEYWCRNAYDLGVPSRNNRNPDDCRVYLNVWGIWYEKDHSCDNDCVVRFKSGSLTSQGDCDKAGMYWDDVAKKCAAPLR
jgi:hypothetical protein